MRFGSIVFTVFCVLITARISHEQFIATSEWNLNKKFGKIQTSETTLQINHRLPLKSQKFEVIDFFFNSIKNEVNQLPKLVEYLKNGIDKKLDFQQMQQQSQSISNFQPTVGNKQDFQIIYLGTKWCGAGDIAQNKRDIGYFYLTDSCCRAHDLCPNALEPNSTKYGLKNPGKFTRSHCDCDDEFYRCLKSVNTLVSKQIGIVYFNILGPQCFKKDHPVDCLKKSRNRCVSYNRNMLQPKLYQWFDNKWF